ncbi:MAG: hypothetical protein Greene041619_304 [Candidatus Peregrinibacteria bacterium Greene0416_19]|nr:MAG: hypothetical protein Greene041619_304 [Candidatus Peregrinibacteria bacterium Greene0416_19]
MSWALGDQTVQVEFQGEFVVPYDRKIVAHGHDAAAVLAEAARVTGKRENELALVGIIDPLLEMPYDQSLFAEREQTS